MTDAFVTCNGQRLTALTVSVANVGPWIAELDFELAPDVSGRVEIKVGETLTLVGTVVPTQDGTYIQQRRCRVVAGAGGWGRTLPRKNYANDAGVKAKLVAEDAAREVGETLGSFAPEVERIGANYVRSVGSASRVLEHAIGDVAWWVDYAGRTNVGPRPPVPLAIDDSYDVLMHDPRNRTLTFALNDPSIVQIGSVISKQPLEQPLTVREFDLCVDASSTRIVAWCGGGERERGRLAGLMHAIVARSSDASLFGKYRYRVVTQSDVDGRVNLQAVRKAAGLPDVQPLSMWPGVAGAHAVLEQGAEVLVEFIEGDPTQPIITHFSGQGGAGFVPVSLAFCGSVQAAARQGDLVQSGGVGTQAIFTSGPSVPPGPVPMLEGVPYLVTFSSNPATVGALASPLYGAISTGSPKVRL